MLLRVLTFLHLNKNAFVRTHLNNFFYHFIEDGRSISKASNYLCGRLKKRLKKIAKIICPNFLNLFGLIFGKCSKTR